MKRSLLLVPLVLLLAACGGTRASAPKASHPAQGHPHATPSSSAPTTTSPVAAAPETTETTTTETTTTETTAPTVAAQPPLAPADLAQAVDALRDAKSLRFHFLLGQLSGSNQHFWVVASGAEADGPPAKLALSLQLTGARRLTLTEARIGDTLYLTSKKVAAALPVGKKWLSASLSRSPAFQASLDQTDPRLYGQLLRYVDGPFDAVGAARLDGVPTQVYLGSISLRRIAISYDRDPVVRKLYNSQSLLALRKVGVDLVPAKVWIGADGTLRRFRLTLAAAGVNIVIDGRLSGYGQPVKVTLPPSAIVSQSP